ncbi:Mitochondrial translocator assembly and maintenance protein 41 [Cryptotrichosporon argae]
MSRVALELDALYISTTCRRSRPARPLRRLVSTSAGPSTAGRSDPSSASSGPPRPVPAAPPLTPAQRRAYARLRPVVDSFAAPIDWAVAYGSGVVHQADASFSLPPPLTDFILATPSAAAFHTANIRQNPDHYPLYARVLGGRAVGWAQERWGAGMWYVTNVGIGALQVKYGVITTRDLVHDLEHWSTLYVSGRLHKPVLPLHPPPDVPPAAPPSSPSSPAAPNIYPHILSNHKSALRLALILLPARFTETDLLTQLAGISYLGDPRMAVPGAENPEKVRNIVRGEGARDGLRAIYGGLVGPLGVVERAREKGPDTEEVIYEQPASPQHRAGLLAALPSTLRTAVERAYRARLPEPTVSAPAARTPTSPPGRARGDADAAPGDAFWHAVARDPECTAVVLTQLRHIVRRPALTQSLKGLFTAGLAKSVYYSAAKFRKWLRGWRRAAGKQA